MEHLFLVNPAAGKEDPTAAVEAAAKCIAGAQNEPYEIRVSRAAGELTELARGAGQSGRELRVYACGGDGTLNRFLNDTEDIRPDCDIYYYPSGSGNDFARDIGAERGATPVLINRYIERLPKICVNGKEHRFINGIGYGIDGYCCEKGDELRGKGNGEVNDTAIAIKGLLFHYKPTGATITVDSVEHRFEKVWLAPTMIGRYYGGGMMPTPEQDRLNGDGAVSVMVYYGSGKLKSLAVFPSIFKGEHIKHSEMVAVLSGRNITVCFDEPRPLQIDGETVPGVREYSVTACEEKVLQPA